MLAATALLMGCTALETEPETLASGALAPGSTLEFGETALLEMPALQGEEGQMSLLSATVLRIEEHTRAEISDLNLEDSLFIGDDYVPYFAYIQVDGVDESSELLAKSSIPLSTYYIPERAEADAAYPGTRVGGFSSNGYPTCDGVLPESWDAESSLKTCTMVMAPPGLTFDRVLYAPTDTGYEDDPVVWEKY